MYQPASINITPVVKAIIITNIVVLAICILIGNVFGINLADYLALHRLNSPLLKPWQFFTHMFLHGGGYLGAGELGANYMNALKHLFYNMVFLWFFGVKLEQVWGGKKFLIFYLVCGLAGAVSHLLFVQYEFNVLQTAINNYLQNPTWDQFNYLLTREVKQNVFSEPLYELLNSWKESPMDKSFSNISVSIINNSLLNPLLRQSMLGASGAVFGIVGAFAYLFPHTKIYLLGFGLPAFWVGFYFLFVEITNQFGFSTADGVARLAHIGGMLAGVILIYIWNKFDKKKFY